MSDPKTTTSDDHHGVTVTEDQGAAPPSGCPVIGHESVTNIAVTANERWWPDQLNLAVLNRNAPQNSPHQDDFDYGAAFAAVDIEALKADLFAVMTDSQPWWPADYGHYGPLFVRMAWHSAGTYRIADGRGGGGAAAQRFAPLNSWPDNVSLDKARRLLWPVKQKYGRSVSWGDLLILAGNCAIESMGLPMLGFGGGRIDDWEPDETYWGPEDEWLGDERYTGDRDLENPLAAVQMGLIYVNPEGPNGNPDPVASARDIRETFSRMAMNDEETVALIAGGHTFGKTHGAADASQYVGPEVEAAPLEQQGFGWRNTFGTGVGGDAITSGLEGAWTTNPIAWDNGFFEVLFGYEWELTKSPAGAHQWRPTDRAADDTVPDAHDPAKRHSPVMLTTDLALRMDPDYEAISRRFHENHQEFADAFNRAWFKLVHRDMGPKSRYVGALVPDEDFIWQDPVPAVDHDLIDEGDIASLGEQLLGSRLTVSQLVRTAWASASSFRGTDKRGGANGALLRLAPQKDWEVNDPQELASVLSTLEGIQRSFNDAQSGNKKVSLADLIVLGGSVAVEKAARDGGIEVTVDFIPGRTDATDEQTDTETFDVLEPRADGFRNYLVAGHKRPPEELLVSRAALLDLTVPEMTVLVGGMRALDANAGGSKLGVLTATPGVLSNDFFVNLLDMGTEWKVSESTEGVYEGSDRGCGEGRWQASAVDLVFGANSQLRANAEYYAADDAKEQFAQDFAAAFSKVMNADRFDVAR